MSLALAKHYGLSADETQLLFRETTLARYKRLKRPIPDGFAHRVEVCNGDFLPVDEKDDWLRGLYALELERERASGAKGEAG